MNAKDFLKGLLYKRSELDDWIRGKGFWYSRMHDQVLGYVPRDRRCKEGMDGSVCTYTYDKTTGARRIVNFEGAPCRINTYGNSFTAGDQVNDGETWQEVLAAHLGEPIRNFGVGGYSTYQMFLRMKREEKRFPAEYIILNIYDDDHYRSLTGWQRIRFGPESLGPPTPYVEANPAEKTFHEYKDPCPEAKDLYDLCNLDWTYERFKDDFCMRIMLAKYNAEKGTPADSYRDIEALSEEHGLRTKIDTARELLETANALFAKSATYASTRIVDKVEAFAAREGKRTLYIASYGAASVANKVRPGRGIRVPEVRKPGSAFNQNFVNFMKKRVPNYVDLMEAHLTDFSTRKAGVLRYIKEYYVAPVTPYTHYAPLGNRFTAFSAKDMLVELLDSKPTSYRGVQGAAAGNLCVNLN